MTPDTAPQPPWRRAGHVAMALCLAAMAVVVFLNIVLRYGFNTGVTASEELSRLLFVWMVFIGATVAYPAGEHMAFTSLLRPLRRRPRLLAAAARLIHALVLLATGLLAWGAWGQVRIGWESVSPVMGYPVALVPLPALLCSTAIAVMAAWNLVRGTPVDLGHDGEPPMDVE